MASFCARVSSGENDSSVFNAVIFFKWGTIALWISHLLTVPRDLGSKPIGGRNNICDFVYICNGR